MQRQYFGTDGIRGVANVAPLDSETLLRLGRAIARIFMRDRGRHRILIGKDTRLSGYMIETALATGITSMGSDVQLVGPLPTPGVAYLTRSMRSDAGIVISASHNPYEDNGIKIFGADGFKLADEIELEIERLMRPGSLDGEHADSSSIGKAFRIDDAVGRYTVSLKNCFPRELSLNGIQLGLDCANGAGYLVAPQTFSELGADVVTRGASPNGRNINAGFGSLYPEVVGKLVRKQSLDIGIALDGDADRAIFVDEKGNVLDGDVILAICALDLHKRELLPKAKVVTTIMANLGLDRCLERAGITAIRTQVGDRYVIEEMRRVGVTLGGEQSGHLIFSDYSTTGDGTLTALRLLEVMVRTGKPLSELAAVFERFPQKLINIKVKNKPPLESIPAIRDVMAAKDAELAGRGRLLVRYSGTENKARVMVECEDEAECKVHAQEVAAVIEQALGTV